MSPVRGVKDDAKQLGALVPTDIAARRLGRTSRQLRRMIRQRRIPAVKDGGRLYLYESTIIAYLGKLPPASKGSE